jgi:hypothetical protein
MPFTVLTLIVAGMLGGAIAVELTALVIIAAAVLALVAICNGVRRLANMWTHLSAD